VNVRGWVDVGGRGARIEGWVSWQLAAVVTRLLFGKAMNRNNECKMGAWPYMNAYE
jgi:hypothetical protein